jgi:V-type H+-transporting ATPase subunit E
MYQLMEPVVKVQCRKQDVALVKVAMAEAKDLYLKNMSKKVEVSVDESEYLPENSAGGVVLSVMDGRIKCTNTLETRLELLGEKVLLKFKHVVYLFADAP